MAVQRGTAAVRMAAPQINVPVRPRQPEKPRLVPQQRRPQSSRSAQNAAASALRVARIALICLAAFVMLSLLIFQRAKIASLNVERVRMEEQLVEAKSETVRLDALFKSKVSVESVEEYAKNHLGMVKRSNYQVHFFDNDNNDEIILADRIGK
ncbi:MAG: hypothetical protein IJT44_12360 [Clostridia bacterium]|nr:hypothetical protein [Clostridia bacterium]